MSTIQLGATVVDDWPPKHSVDAFESIDDLGCSDWLDFGSAKYWDIHVITEQSVESFLLLR